MLSRLIVWLGVTLLTVWAAATAPTVHSPDWAAIGVSLEKDRVYRTIDSRRATLDVYRPADVMDALGSGRLRPAVIAVHGGSWIGGSKTTFRHDSQYTVIRLAQGGMCVFAIDYRLARPGSPSWPAVVEDLRAAVRWVRDHAAEFGVDPSRIVVFGQSAGGHLAALLATLPDERADDEVSSRVQAVISFYGPTDLVGLVSARRLAHDPAFTLLGNPGSSLAEGAAEASPVRHVTEDDPPMLLIHGSDDAWVPLDQSVTMATALAKAGVPHRLIVVEGARHGFESFVGGPKRRDLLPEIFAFLESVWNISTVAAAPNSCCDNQSIAIRARE
jgi:acetyl esterase/lipase